MAPFESKHQVNEIEQYRRMQKDFYQSDACTPEAIVGNYGWHEHFPYETNLLYRYADARLPVLREPTRARALDVGCGPGRMIGRMKRFLGQVDGADISRRLLDEAKRVHPESEFFETTGDNLGDAPADTYDFVYSTIALQHIAVRTIRLKIFDEIRRVLKPGGCFTLQFAYLDTLPSVVGHGGNLIERLGFRPVRLLQGHAAWDEDKVDASGTNSACDVTIGPATIDLAVRDFERSFDSVEHWFYDIRICLSNLRGESHGAYWPSHWVFFHGRKSPR